MDSMITVYITCEEGEDKWESKLTLPSSTTIQDVRFQFFQDIAQNYKKMPSNFYFEFNDEILDSKKSLSELCEQDEIELKAKPKLQGGKVSPMDFANMQKKVEMKFGKAPQWRTIAPGLNTCSYCVNPKCVAVNQEVIKIFNFVKEFNVKQMQRGVTCPMCGKTTERFQNIIYYKTKLLIRYSKLGAKRQTPIEEIANEIPLSFDRTYPGSTSQYLNIFITAQPLN